LIYEFKLPGKRSPNVKVEMSFITGKHKVFVNGKEVEPRQRKIFDIPMTKTRTERLRLVPNVLELGMDVVFKDEKIKVSKDITKLEYLTAYFPLFMGILASYFFDAGMISSIVMGVSSVFFSLMNMKVLQGDKNPLAKLIYNGVIVGMSWVGFYIISLIEKSF
jgi:hypothetical protein